MRAGPRSGRMPRSRNNTLIGSCSFSLRSRRTPGIGPSDVCWGGTSALRQGSTTFHTPPNYVVEDGTTQRKPPEVRIWTLRNQSRYASAFHFHTTLPSMLRSMLIRDEIIQMCEPREKRLLA